MDTSKQRNNHIKLLESLAAKNQCIFSKVILKYKIYPRGLVLVLWLGTCNFTVKLFISTYQIHALEISTYAETEIRCEEKLEPPASKPADTSIKFILKCLDVGNTTWSHTASRES